MTAAAAVRVPVVWMFSGQGAQYFHMGRALYERNATFRKWMDRLDAYAAPYVGQSIVGVLYDDSRTKAQPFDEMLCSHPALFMVQYSLAQTLLAEAFPAPDYLLGASLGEFIAAAVAGVASAESMLFDLIRQARLFEAHCSGGAMLVVIDDIDTFATNPAYAEGCELAGVSFDHCFVVSGTRRAIDRIAAVLKQQDVTHQILPVGVAFHSSLVDNVAQTFERMLAGRAYGPAKIPIISCAAPGGDTRGKIEKAEKVDQGEAAFSPAHWWHVIRSPIGFRQAFAAFRRTHPRAVYLDLGPSGNMATYAKYNVAADTHAAILPIMTPFGRDDESLAAARAALPALLG